MSQPYHVPCWAAAVALSLLGGCAPDSEDAFVAGRNLDPCIQALPACPGLYAGCALDEGNFTRQTLPGDIRFLVRADPETDIVIEMFLKNEHNAGVSTLIYWNEPGCSDVYTFDSGGRDLFEEADGHILRKSKRVHEGGLHLVEIVSDMQVDATIAVSLVEGGS
jgi:hypothetical protein